VSKQKREDQYVSMRIAPSVRAEIKRVVNQLKVLNPQWSESRLVNIAMRDWADKISRLNDTELERLFDTYEDLKVGHDGLLK
jgi:hypothetical protein